MAILTVVVYSIDLYKLVFNFNIRNVFYQTQTCSCINTFFFHYPGGDVVVNAPMDGEAVYMSFFKSVGDSVAKNEVVVEVESDKVGAHFTDVLLLK